jgi:predicted nucleic acid-binding protein
MIYLDASAIYKLIVEESESRSLREFLAERSGKVSSALARVEVERALLRTQSLERRRHLSAAILGQVNLLAISGAILSQAGMVGAPDLRSLDAIHLATALSVPDLQGMVVYDRRLARAAEAAGLRVWAPGREPV